MNRNFASLILLCATWLNSPVAASAVTIQWSPVGNPGNANDPADGDSDTPGIQHFGAVPYAYKIGTNDVTNSQYAEFLNTKDPSGANLLGLWNFEMADATYGGISFNVGNPTGGKYVLTSGRQNHPVNFVTWYDTIRFANWLNNGQGNGDTETGAYTLGPLGAGGVPTNGNGITRNAGATVFLPSENEWYKAAYYNPATSSYYKYPTSSNTAPMDSLPTAIANHANYNNAVGNLTDVGAYTGTTSPVGAFDMGGNVAQWNDSFSGSINFPRGLRANGYDGFLGSPSSYRDPQAPTWENDVIGFRVASVLMFVGTWTGASSTSWADIGNWSGAVPGTNAGTTTTDTAIFNQNAVHSPLTIDAGRNIQNITFDTASVNSMTVGTIGGQALLLTAGGTIQTTSTVVNAETINAPLVLEGDYIFTSGASSSSGTLSFGGGITPAATNGATTLTLNGGNTGANTISGVLADNGAGQLAVTKSGLGLWILSGANTYSGNTVVSGGTLKFNISSGTPTISAGATATVAAGATLELAGSVSALGTAGGNRTHILNNSNAPGLVVSGTHQVVGGIDGSGSVQVNALSDLTVDHIVQSALVIGGTAGNPGLVTIDDSDADGNPLTGGLSLTGSLASNGPFAADVVSAGLFDGAASKVASSAGSEFTTGDLSTGGGSAAVPEPSTLALAGCGLAIAAVVSLRRRRCRLNTTHLSLTTVNRPPNS